MEEQASDSGIRWRPWERSAFEEAARTGKPVLLRLSAFWCHWCRVQEKGSDSDPQVAEAVARDFVPVKVDIDKRPDLRDRYSMGGYPTSAVLAPDGRLLTGATYVPPSEFLRLLETGLAAHRRSTTEAPLRPAPSGRAPSTPENLRAAQQAVVHSVLDEYDWRHHGFGDQPKFPQPAACHLLLASAFREGTPRAAKAAIESLRAMARGGIYDPIDGGFFRFSVEADWKDPHFEKMLDANAQILQIFAFAAAWTSDRELEKTAGDVAGYIDRTMALPGAHLWGGSQAPDEEYYRKHARGRAAHGSPPVDPVVYVDACAMAISAFATAGCALGRPEWIARARGALKELLLSGCTAGGSVFHYREDGLWKRPGLLRDTVSLATASLDVSCATGEARWLELARKLAREGLPAFEDDPVGALYDREVRSADPGEPALAPDISVFDNGLAASFLLRLDAIEADRESADRARRILRALAEVAAQFGVFASPFGLALIGLHHGVLVTDALSPKGPQDSHELARTAFGICSALGPSAVRLTSGKRRAVSICVGDRCSALVDSPDAIHRAIESVTSISNPARDSELSVP